MSSQIVVSALRWIAIALFVGGTTAVASLTAGDSWQKATLKGLGDGLPILLGALGWGGYDAHRASVAKEQVKAGVPVTALHAYDVGYHLIDEYDRLAIDYAELCLEHQDLKDRVGSP
jgi:hypothetical protein